MEALSDKEPAVQQPAFDWSAFWGMIDQRIAAVIDAQDRRPNFA
jgi:hypothetical protein